MISTKIIFLFVDTLCALVCFVDTRVYVSLDRINDQKHVINGTEVLSFAPRLANEFVKMARDELGTMTMQAALDQLEYEPKPEDSAKWELDSLVDQLSLRLRHYGHLVSNPKALVVQMYREHQKSPIAPRFDCCNLAERDLRYEALYGARVSRRKCCDLIPFNLPVNAFNPGHNLTQRFRRQLEYWPNVKWLYFITAAGLHTEFPAHNFRAATATAALLETIALWQQQQQQQQQDAVSATAKQQTKQQYQSPQRARRHLPLPSMLTALYDCQSVQQLRHRDVFVRSVIGRPIWLVVVLDQSEVSKTRLLLGQRVARLLLASLSEKDLVALVMAPSSDDDPGHADEATHSLMPATHETKLFLGERIYASRGSGVTKTNHTRALLAAFRILREAIEAQKREPPEASKFGPPTDNLMIAYISRGSLDDLQEQNATLRQVTAEQARLHNRVVINTYMPVEEKSATVLFEKTFMNDLATRWNVHSASVVRPGHFFVINRTSDLAATVGRFYQVWLSPPNTTTTTTTTTSPVSKLTFSLPHEDLEGRGLVMSISQAFYDGSTLLGVMGVDLVVGDLLDQVIHYGGSPASSSVFMMDAASGLAVYHPGGLHDLLVSPTGTPRTPSIAATSGGRGGGDGSPTTAAFNRDPLLHVDVRLLERTPGFEDLVVTRILAGEVNGTAEWVVEIDSESFARIETTGVWSEALGHIVQLKDDSATEWSQCRTRRLKVTYRWRRITDPDTQFVLVMRSTRPLDAPPPRQLVELTPPFDSWYHRLDLFKRDQACLYLRQLATFSSATVYLPPRTFMRPFEHLTSAFAHSPVSSDFDADAMVVVGGGGGGGGGGGSGGRSGEGAEDARHLVAFLTDQTALISNPGLRVSPVSSGGGPSAPAPDARTAVAVVEKIAKFWRQRGAAAGSVSALGKFIIRRYVSTDGGVMLMYPGTLMPQSFDATARPWFARAAEAPGRIVFTQPYLDHGGAGLIVTIASAVFEGNQSGTHDPSIDRLQAVMAMDVPYRLFNHLLSTWLPRLCGQGARDPAPTSTSSQREVPKELLELLMGRGVRVDLSGVQEASTANQTNREEGEKVEEEQKETVKCLLMNDRGYLLAHPDYAQPVRRVNKALESGHISHREPLVAADLLNHEEFVRKVACVSHSQRTLERYYVYNTSYKGVVSNSAPGDHCTRYQFAAVPGTNLFIGLVRELPQHHPQQRVRHRVRRANTAASEAASTVCSPRSAFCACSTKDRRCLNCGRLEPLECECPCQCPLGVVVPSTTANNITANPLESHPTCLAMSLEAAPLPLPKAAAAASWKALARLPDAPPLCQPSTSSTSTRVPVATLADWLKLLLPASAATAAEAWNISNGPLVSALGPTDCATLSGVGTECQASIGCELCLLGPDGRPLGSGKAFCAPMGVCFGGEVGGSSPYNGNSEGKAMGGEGGFSDDRWGSELMAFPLPRGLPMPTGSAYFYQHLLPPPPPPPPLPYPPPPLSSSSSSHARSASSAAAAHFYHYYYHYYHHFYHNGNPETDGSASSSALIPPLPPLPPPAYLLAPPHYGMGPEGASGSLLGVWTSSPVGPVAGAMMAVFIVILLGIYCLRHQAASRMRLNDAAAVMIASTSGVPGGLEGGDTASGLLGDEEGGKSARCGKHQAEKACCCERPPEGDTDLDKPPPSAGAVALLVKSSGRTAASSSAGSAVAADEVAGGGSGGGGSTDTESDGGGLRPRPPLSPPPSASAAAAIIIEGVGVFVKSNAFSNEELARVPEEPRCLPLAEFVTDPTAVSPYRVADEGEERQGSTNDGAGNGGGGGSGDDQGTTVSSSVATTTDHGYVSNDGPSSSCAESSSLADSVIPGPPTTVGLSSEVETEEYSGGPWIGTLIMGRGMDDVMCAEELKNQLLRISAKRGRMNRQTSSLQHPSQPQPKQQQQHLLVPSSSCKTSPPLAPSRGRLLPSWRRAYQHYRSLHRPETPPKPSVTASSGCRHSGRATEVGLSRFPVLVQPPPQRRQQQDLLEATESSDNIV